MTSRQFYIVFWLIVVSLKVQKMPSMMYEFMRKDFYLMLVPYIIINVIGIFMAFFILKRTQKQTLSRQNESKFGNF